MISEHNMVVLTHTQPEAGLQAGDVGTVVHVYQGGEAYEIEFSRMDGGLVALITVPAGHIRPVGCHDLFHVREVTA